MVSPRTWRGRGRRLRRGFRKHQRQQGAIILLFVLLLPFLISMVAFSVDVGNLYRVRTEGQSAVDSAALAGAGALNGTLINMSVAENRAEAYGEEHYAYDDDVELQAADIEVGNWDIDSSTFTTPAASAVEANAVRVTYNEPAVSTPFSAVQAQGSYAVTGTAIGLGGGPSSSACAFPLVVADCALSDAVENNDCNLCLTLQSAMDDNAAWTSFGANGNGVPQIKAAIEGACFINGVPSVDADGNCAGDGSGCVGSEVEDEVDLNGGSIMNPSPQGFCQLIYDILTRNGPGTVTPFTVESPVIETGLSGANCGTASLNGSDKPIAGHVKIDIFGVQCGNASPPAVAPPPNGSSIGDCTAPSGQFLLASLHRDNGSCDDTPQDAPAGGKFFGTLGRPRLVE